MMIMPQHKGVIPWNKGVPTSDEVKQKISESSKGRKPNAGSFKSNGSPWNKGKKGIYSDETKDKMSESHKGINVWSKGKTFSEEHKKNLSKSHMNKPSAMKGKNHTDETKLKISESRKGIVPWNLGKKGQYSLPSRLLSEETRKKISRSKMGTPSWNTGKPLSKEHRFKLSIAAMDRCAIVRNLNYTQGRVFKKYCKKFNSGLRRRVRAFFSDRCLLCGKTSEKNGELLSVHHVYAEKLACCEVLITEMDEVRKLFPPEIARFGESEFSPEEIIRIRMMAPLCKVCHSKTIFWNDKAMKIMKELDNIIMKQYGGKCYFHKDEYKAYLLLNPPLKFLEA